MENAGGFVNDVLDDLVLSDPAVVSSTVTSILSIINPTPYADDEDDDDASAVRLHNGCYCLLSLNGYVYYYFFNYYYHLFIKMRT